MKTLLQRIRQILKSRRVRKIWYSTISSIAALVIFVTTYALVLPAITLESNAAMCGIEAHQHTDDCYEEKLVCGQEESEGHHHDDGCYSVSKKLVCDIVEHQHDDSCYDQDGNLVCEEKEHTHSDDCYQEVRKLTCGKEESEGHHHDSSCYEKVLVCGKEAHTHSEKCYEKVAEDASKAGTTEKADEVKSDAPEKQEEKASETKAPKLDPVNMEAMLNKHTDMYYFHAEDGEEIPADSMEIKDWQKVKDSTELASDDLVRLYLAYTIPAGSLNETNPVARYRLPENVKLTDKQIKAINENENGIAAAYTKDSADYKKYLGAEAVEGDRRPGEILKDGEQEYISAVVKAENVYKNDKYIGQDLIFTFVPYTVEKNQNTYDANGNTVKAGQKVTGWFACDFNLSQVEWTEDESSSNADDDAEETGRRTVEKTAEIIFAAEDKKEDIEEISRTLKLVEQDEKGAQDNEPEEELEREPEKEPEPEYKSGTLTSDGDGYTVTMDYTADAKIPENARLSVREITAETDNDSYEEYLAQAEQHVAESGENKANVDKEATRFFDIEILVDDGNGNEYKIEPAAPVNVRIQMDDAPAASEGGQQSDPTVLHFAEEGVETIDATAGEATVEESTAKTNKKTDKTADSSAEAGDATEICFEAESFSVYGVVYTVDFHWEVDGKTYDFSIPGGGFISFAHIIEALGISSFDGYRVVEASSENAGEKSTADKESAYKEAIRLNDAEVSNETRDFLADVEQVRFSNPELVWIEKVQERTTIGAMKEAFDLDVEYSADLTEEQINEINAQSVEDGDWALISLHPFKSEESLTVTMKDGEVFTIKVTDGQLHTYVISDSGDTYEVIVTYDDTAEIPEDARLEVSEIGPDSEKYAKNIELTNAELAARNEEQVYNPVQFDISIVSGDKIIEPKEGSKVNVEIRLAKSVFGDQISEEVLTVGESVEAGSVEEELSALPEETASDDEKGMFLVNGQFIEDEDQKLTECRAAHITDEGNAELIGEVQSSVADDRIIMQFETESFSDYLFAAGNSGNGLYDLPNTIYVGDEIYMWHEGHMWVSNIGSVVTETKHNNSDDLKTVTAINTGTFRIYNKNNQREYKEITVRPARTGTTPPATIDTIDNASIGLTLNLFDYDLDSSLDSYFNNYNHDDNPVSQVFLNENDSINQNHALKFWGSGIGNNHGSHNEYNNTMITNIVYNNTTNGYPVLRTNTTSLDYLFTPLDGTDKKAYTNVNHLFKKEGDYYVYDSNVNYAYYDKSQGNGGNFAVYNSTYKQKRGGESGSIQNKAIGFFPFHPWDDQYDLYVNWNKNLNHHFGMSMSVDFSLPKDPKAVVDTEGNPIVFEFSGDDDLWVFIDGKLAMDIGGIHQPTSGTINFQDGTVKIKGSTEGSVETTQMNNAAFTRQFSNLYDGNTHTMQVFYIERGGCDSNCKIMFNLTQYGDIHFDKVDKDNPSDKLAGAVFGIYKDAECTEPLMERLNASHDNISRAYVAESDASGHVQFSDIPLGTYYLKELHAPEGYPLDDTVHTVQVFYDQAAQQVKIKVTIDGMAVENGVKITNKKPVPITLGLQKEWQNEAGGTIAAPAGAEATFEIKRIRNYETYREEAIEGQGREVSHLTVGWIHNGQMHVHGEYDLIVGTTATVSWDYNTGYTGSKDCIVNGTRINKDYVTGNVISEALTMPAAGQTATIYIVDDSENGEAIRSINVAGSQFYGNSGGGVIHKFTTHTEPDPDFSYTGDHVTDNQVKLPIDSNTWSYDFTDLPTFDRGTVVVDGTSYDVAFNYSYYLEEVSNTAPEGTTVVYKDLNGNVINSPTDAETSTSGTQTITNRIPFGYLKIKKEVTYNGSSNNLTADQKSKLAGTYKFKIYTKQQCGVADAVQDPNAPEDAEDKDLIITITIGENGQAVSSDPIKLLAGNYWIKEVESSNPMMFPVANPITATVTKDNTTNNAVISSLTNNYDENNGPDKISIDIEKKFQGLDSITQIPAEFQVTLQYKIGNETKTCTLGNGNATGQNGETISFTTKDHGFTWHWHVGNIDPEAKEFKIKESNYNKAKGYDWKKAFLDTVVTTGNEVVLDTVDITDTVNDWHNLNITAPAAELSEVTNDRRTSDSHSNTEFYLDDTDVLLSKLTGNNGVTVTLVISKHPLNLMERDAVKKGLPNQFKDTCVFYSIDEHPNGFQFQSGKDNKKVTFGEKNGRATVKFTQGASAQESVWLVTYDSQEARNNANLVNTYEEIPITIDIIKVDEKDSSKKLPGAVFTLRQIADVAPVHGELRTLDGTNPIDSDETDDNGKTSFGNLTHGYYEITEKNAPDGYIKSEEITSYFKIENGVVKWLVKGNNKPSDWTEKTAKAEGELVDFDEAHPAVEANPELHIEAQPATNAVFTVENEPGAALPNTGGPGTRLFTILGSILILGAGVRLWRRRRLI